MSGKIRRAFETLTDEGPGPLLRKVNRRVGVIPPSGTPTGRTCLMPFHHLGVTEGGEVQLCCAGWVKYRLGVLSETNTLTRLWNNRVARTFRQAMLSTELDRVCSASACPHIGSGRLPAWGAESVVPYSGDSDLYPDDIADDPDVLRAFRDRETSLEYLPKSLEIGADLRCNLHCPSCRRERITGISPNDERILNLLLRNLEELAPSLRHLSLLGSGEVFYSPFGMSVLRGLDRRTYPHLAVDLLTNGQLLNEKRWESLGAGAELIRDVGVSIDAATEETYADVRRGGSWSNLHRNLGFLRELRKQENLRTGLNFVIQARNFREIPAFIRMGQEFEVDRVVFLYVQKWGNVMSSAEYEAQAVHDPAHPRHAELLTVLEAPECSLPGVMLPG